MGAHHERRVCRGDRSNAAGDAGKPTAHVLPSVYRSLSIKEIIRSNDLLMHFQPIFSARQRSIVGLEGLVRSSRGMATDTRSPDWLFRTAAREGVTADLERLCCENAIRCFARVARGRGDLVLFLNLGSLMIQPSHEAVDQLKRLASAAGLAPNMIAVEILETKIDDVAHLQNLARLLRERGFLLALDDVGAGHSNLGRVPLIKPDVLKIDRSLISHIDGDFHKQETVKSVVGLSRKIGALVVAEGIEREEEAIVAMELGADLLQGYFLGYPNEDGLARGDGFTELTGGIESLARKFKIHMIEKINDRKLQHRRFNIVLDEILCHLASADVDRFDEILGKAIQSHPTVECVYILDEGGLQLTETIWNTNVRRRVGGAIFHPAPKGTDHSLKEYYYILLDVELKKYTTEPYVSSASGNISRTISTYFRAHNGKLHILCIDVLSD
jgi:EAL domain-containing protein (putative c-di-GMP-specific phosphodiesterase class I)